MHGKQAPFDSALAVFTGSKLRTTEDPEARNVNNQTRRPLDSGINGPGFDEGFTRPSIKFPGHRVLCADPDHNYGQVTDAEGRHIHVRPFDL